MHVDLLGAVRRDHLLDINVDHRHDTDDIRIAMHVDPLGAARLVQRRVDPALEFRASLYSLGGAPPVGGPPLRPDPVPTSPWCKIGDTTAAVAEFLDVEALVTLAQTCARTRVICNEGMPHVWRSLLIRDFSFDIAGDEAMAPPYVQYRIRYTWRYNRTTALNREANGSVAIRPPWANGLPPASLDEPAWRRALAAAIAWAARLSTTAEHDAATEHVTPVARRRDTSSVRVHALSSTRHRVWKRLRRCGGRPPRPCVRSGRARAHRSASPSGAVATRFGNTGTDTEERGDPVDMAAALEEYATPGTAADERTRDAAVPSSTSDDVAIDPPSISGYPAPVQVNASDGAPPVRGPPLRPDPVPTSPWCKIGDTTAAVAEFLDVEALVTLAQTCARTRVICNEGMPHVWRSLLIRDFSFDIAGDEAMAPPYVQYRIRYTWRYNRTTALNREANGSVAIRPPWANGLPPASLDEPAWRRALAAAIAWAARLSTTAEHDAATEHVTPVARRRDTSSVRVHALSSTRHRVWKRLRRCGGRPPRPCVRSGRARAHRSASPSGAVATRFGNTGTDTEERGDPVDMAAALEEYATPGTAADERTRDAAVPSSTSDDVAIDPPSISGYPAPVQVNASDAAVPARTNTVAGVTPSTPTMVQVDVAHMTIVHDNAPTACCKDEDSAWVLGLGQLVVPRVPELSAPAKAAAEEAAEKAAADKDAVEKAAADKVAVEKAAADMAAVETVTMVHDDVAALDDDVAALDHEVAAVDDETTAFDEDVAAVDDEVAAVNDEVDDNPEDHFGPWSLDGQDDLDAFQDDAGERTTLPSARAVQVPLLKRVARTLATGIGKVFAHPYPWDWASGIRTCAAPGVLAKGFMWIYATLIAATLWGPSPLIIAMATPEARSRKPQLWTILLVILLFAPAVSPPSCAINAEQPVDRWASYPWSRSEPSGLPPWPQRQGTADSDRSGTWASPYTALRQRDWAMPPRRAHTHKPRNTTRDRERAPPRPSARANRHPRTRRPQRGEEPSEPPTLNLLSRANERMLWLVTAVRGLWANERLIWLVTGLRVLWAVALLAVGILGPLLAAAAIVSSPTGMGVLILVCLTVASMARAQHHATTRHTTAPAERPTPAPVDPTAHTCPDHAHCQPMGLRGGGHGVATCFAIIKNTRKACGRTIPCQYHGDRHPCATPTTAAVDRDRGSSPPPAPPSPRPPLPSSCPPSPSAAPFNPPFMGGPVRFSPRIPVERSIESTATPPVPAPQAQPATCEAPDDTCAPDEPRPPLAPDAPHTAATPLSRVLPLGMVPPEEYGASLAKAPREYKVAPTAPLQPQPSVAVLPRRVLPLGMVPPEEYGVSLAKAPREYKVTPTAPLRPQPSVAVLPRRVLPLGMVPPEEYGVSLAKAPREYKVTPTAPLRPQPSVAVLPRRVLPLGMVPPEEYGASRAKSARDSAACPDADCPRPAASTPPHASPHTPQPATPTPLCYFWDAAPAHRPPPPATGVEGLPSATRGSSVNAWTARRQASRKLALSQSRPSTLVGPLKVLVDTPSGDFFVVWADATTSLAAFRNLVRDVTGTEAGMQRWAWEGRDEAGKKLDEAVETLGGLGVYHGATIVMQWRLRGGMESARNRTDRKGADLGNMGSPEPAKGRSKTPAPSSRSQGPHLAASAPSSPTRARRGAAKTPARHTSPSSAFSPSDSLAREYRDSVSSTATSTHTARSGTTSLAASRSPSHATGDAHRFGPPPRSSEVTIPPHTAVTMAAPQGPQEVTSFALDLTGPRAPTSEIMVGHDRDLGSPGRSASEAQSSDWGSEPGDVEDEGFGLARGRQTSFVCPICPGKIIEAANYQHLSSHLKSNPLSIPDSFFDDPSMPVKRCPTCRKVWYQRKRNGGPPTCKRCSKGATPRPTGTPTPRQTPEQARPPTPSTPRGASARRDEPRRVCPAPTGPPTRSAPTTEHTGPWPLPGAAPPLPTVEEVCLLDVRVMAHIPKILRHAVAQSWGKACSAAAWDSASGQGGTGDKWVTTFMFSKVIFGTDPQQARGFTTPDEVKARLARWDAGQGAYMWSELADSAHRHSAKKNAKGKRATIPTLKVERAEKLVREGQFSKALQALMSAPSKLKDAATRMALELLHPKRHQGPRPVQGPAGPYTAITVEEALKALRSFRTGSSPGALQIRIEFIREAADADPSGGFLKNFVAMLNVLQRGAAPPCIRASFAGAALSALEKKDGGTRPIAAGESLRRVIGKVLCARVKGKAATFFAPLQFGVACSHGTERIVHRARRFWESCGDRNDVCMVKWDFRNAFNSIARSEILALVAREFPELSTWVWWTYGESTHLFYDHGHLVSEEGVQQGDPLGPLLFSLALKSLTTEVHAQCPDLHLHAWYLDDGVVAGCTADVLRACNIVQASAARIGLDLNLGKCEVIFSRRPREDPFPADVVAKDGKVLRAGYKRIYTFPNGGFDLLGTPIGTDKFVDEYVERKVLVRCAAAFDAARTLDDPHVAYCLLRSTCGFSRLVHILRTVPPTQARKGARAFDEALYKAARACLRVPLPDPVWAQACLSVARGGLGLRLTSPHRSAAYIASVSECAHLDSWDAASCGHWDAAVTEYDSLVEPLARVGSSPVPTAPRTQHDLSEKIDDVVFAQRVASVDERDVFLVAHLKSVGTADAGLWLDNAPCQTLGMAFTPAAFTALIRWRLGLPVVGEGQVCSFCKSCGADQRGYHLLTCRWGGNLGVRHDGVRDVFYSACVAAAWSPAKEVNIFPSGQARAADVLARASTRRAFDFAITHGCQPKYVDKTAASGPHAAGEYGVSVKDAKYKVKAAAEGVLFVAMVTDVHGNWSVKALETFLELSRDIAARRGAIVGGQLRFLKKRLACAIMRGNARALTHQLDPLEPDLEADELEPEPARESEGGPGLSSSDDSDNEDGSALHQSLAGQSLCMFVCESS